ncbi:hypothetical protein [Nonomuraea sp. NPDC052265]
MGTRGHSDYLAAGSTALANLARIVTGRPVSWTKGARQGRRNVGEGG